MEVPENATYGPVRKWSTAKDTVETISQVTLQGLSLNQNVQQTTAKIRKYTEVCVLNTIECLCGTVDTMDVEGLPRSTTPAWYIIEWSSNTANHDNTKMGYSMLL